MRHYGTVASSSSSAGGSPSGAPDKSPAGALPVPASNVNVKEAVTVFNQIAAQREK